MEVVENDNHVKVKRICASCQVKQKFICPKWEMSDGLKNAGLQTGEVVRLKGTQETIIH